MTSHPYIESPEELRGLFPEPGERALRKELKLLDRHCSRFIELSPFVVVASGNGRSLDASPRGGLPGFVKVIDPRTLSIPDARGNNRLDSLTNIVTSGRIGLLFLIPGVDETLRVNGGARLRAEPASGLVIEVTVEEAYLHCAKALMRSRLWAEDAKLPRTALPTMGEMLAEQTGAPGTPESQEEMVARYRSDL